MNLVYCSRGVFSLTALSLSRNCTEIQFPETDTVEAGTDQLGKQLVFALYV